MKWIKSFKRFESSNWTPEEIIKDLTYDLRGAGLEVNIYSGSYKYSNHPKFEGDFHIEIKDSDKIFCKNYPEDDMDWLSGKPIIHEFIKDLESYGFKDFKIYGGGLSVNIVFKLKSYKTFESSTNLMIQKYGEEVVGKTDTLIGEIGRMLIDLNHSGIEYSVNYSPLTLVGREDSPKIVVQAWPSSKQYNAYSELIESTFDEIKMWVKNLGYATGSHNWSDDPFVENSPKTFQLLIQ